MLHALMTGFLVIFVVVSLLFLPQLCWYPPAEVLHYCTLTITIMAWLWMVIAPPLLLCFRLGQRLISIRLERHPAPPR